MKIDYASWNACLGIRVIAIKSVLGSGSVLVGHVITTRRIECIGNGPIWILESWTSDGNFDIQVSVEKNK